MWKTRNNYIKNTELEKPQFLFSVDKNKDGKIKNDDQKILEDQERDLRHHLDKVKEMQSVMYTR
jgi:hypothetical protein